MFKKGDALTYTGEFRNACADLAKQYGREGWFFCRYNNYSAASEKGGILYAARTLGGAENAFWNGDMQRGAPAEPEPYEAWFV